MATQFQDDLGPVGPLAIFHEGAAVADAPESPELADALRNRLEPMYPGCEVLARCPRHPDAAAVDCLHCWPLDG